MDARDLEGGGPSNTPPHNTRIVASGCDSLYLGYFGDLEPELARRFSTLRDHLLAEPESGNSISWDAPETRIELAGTEFAFTPCAQSGFRYQLRNGDVTLWIRRKSTPPVPTLTVQLRSIFLWEVGWQRASAIVGRRVAAVLEPIDRPPIVSRVDLCADFQGWTPQLDDLERFVGRAKLASTFHDVGEFSGFRFGKSGIVARLYNKSREILKSNKLWMCEVWPPAWTPGETVWRLEFQVRRPVLRELGISSQADLGKAMSPLWNYLSMDWLRLVILRPGTRRERCPVDPAWSVLQGAELGSAGGELVRQRATTTERGRLASALLGDLSKLGAIAGVHDLTSAMRLARAEISARLERSATTFRDHVIPKATRLARLGKSPS